MKIISPACLVFIVAATIGMQGCTVTAAAGGGPGSASQGAGGGVSQAGVTDNTASFNNNPTLALQLAASPQGLNGNLRVLPINAPFALQLPETIPGAVLPGLLEPAASAAAPALDALGAMPASIADATSPAAQAVPATLAGILPAGPSISLTPGGAPATVLPNRNGSGLQQISTLPALSPALNQLSNFLTGNR